MLKPLDVVVLCALIARHEARILSQAELARRLNISQASVHRALKQLEASRLWRPADRAVNLLAARELLLYAVRHVYPPELGAPVRGVPSVVVGQLESVLELSVVPFVWAYEAGLAFGPSLAPLHACVPAAAVKDRSLHELLALVDALRVGRVRERTAATAALHAILERARASH